MLGVDVIKRIRDLVIAMLVLLFCLPLFLVVAVIIKLDSPGPVLFKQIRIGFEGEPFVFYKFRSMIWGADTEGPSSKPIKDFQSYYFHSIGDDSRVTRSGRILRVTTIDELPQLFNVIKGDMSLVGPRPELPEIVSQYPNSYHDRHSVKPGMTGLAAVMGRSDLTYHKVMEYDLSYVQAHSLLSDFGIMIRTIYFVITGKGAR